MNTGDHWFVVGLSALWAVFFGGLAWHCGQILRHVTYVTLADGRRQERRLPLLFRLLLPLAPNLKPLFGRPAFAATREQLNARIIAAGLEGLLAGEEILALRLLEPLTLGIVAGAVTWLALSVSTGRAAELLAHSQLSVCAIVLLWGYVHPVLWLRRALKTRHTRIQRALPFVLDLLTLSVEAGLDFMTALQRIIDRRAVDPIGEELIRVLREIQLGRTRREALRDMAARVNQSDIRLVVNALVQADELGVGIGAILRIQADQMRSKRFERAEKLANEAPVKLLLPLLACIFPAVFLVLLGPIILQLIRQL